MKLHTPNKQPHAVCVADYAGTTSVTNALRGHMLGRAVTPLRFPAVSALLLLAAANLLLEVVGASVIKVPQHDARFLSSASHSTQGALELPSSVRRQLLQASDCPSGYRYRCFFQWGDAACFQTPDQAAACSGPAHSWCALQGGSDSLTSQIPSNGDWCSTVFQCPSGYPYRCYGQWGDAACFQTSDHAAACSGPATTWCALPGAPASLTDQIPSYGDWCPSEYLVSCPLGYPYRCFGQWGDAACFQTPDQAAACSGPATTWCALPGAPASLTDLIPSNGDWCPPASSDPSCPWGYPYRCFGQWGDAACFQTSEQAAACSGPATTWCALPGAPTSLTDQIPSNGDWCFTVEPVEPVVVGYWQWTWNATNVTRSPANTTMGIAFSGLAYPVNALSDSQSVYNTLPGVKYISLGGPGNGNWTSATVNATIIAINNGDFVNYSGIAYDIEVGQSGLASAFAASFAAAKAQGLQVLVTVSHSAPYGIADAATLMSSFFSSSNIDYLSPQLYSDGTETANDFSTSTGVEFVDWSAWTNCKPRVVPSIVTADLYPDAQSFFANFTINITTAGYIQWAQV